MAEESGLKAYGEYEGERLYTGEGAEDLTHKQRRKAARLQAQDKTKKLENLLDRKAPNRADDLNKLATKFALQRADDINAKRADLLAGGGGFGDAELRQLTEGGLAAAGQQGASSLEQEIQQNLNAGMSYAQASRSARAQKDVGEQSAEIAAKLKRDGWVADKAKEEQDFQKLDNMTSAFMAQYPEDPDGANALAAAQILGAGGEIFSGIMEEYIGKDWEQSRWALDQETIA